jgi:hypothetical protein
MEPRIYDTTQPIPKKLTPSERRKTKRAPLALARHQQKSSGEKSWEVRKSSTSRLPKRQVLEGSHWIHVIVHADARSDGTDPHSLGRQLYDSRSLRQPLRGALGAYQLLQLLFFSGTQHELSTLLGHGYIQARFRQHVTII